MGFNLPELKALHMQYIKKEGILLGCLLSEKGKFILINNCCPSEFIRLISILDGT